MANNKSSNGCCGCIFGAIAILVVIVLVVAFFVSRYVTIEQVGLADTPGILYRFSDTYSPEDTFRSVGMANWKAYDILMWIIKSGEYTPASST